MTAALREDHFTTPKFKKKLFLIKQEYARLRSAFSR
jgi:hypothetical protein